ncbi:TIGR03750 family conjugal transfer protein [Carnimonas bestiolae]|uniref:TIGR03750 family conjugal transfer protein n=1 Tax=Carnimonas bestiolae TaxID=3402172 RepID=UPI003EDC0F30
MSRDDQTDISINFLPRRLNDVPVVFWGMTMREVGLVCLIGLGVGIIPGIILGFMLSAWAMIPTMMVAFAGLTLLSGGKILRRLRRGRPTNAMYRDINFWLAKNGIPTAGEHIIHRSTPYRISRDKRNRS